MYKCEHNHSYDIAKEGYVNLLPVQKKNSKNPGDSKEMIIARRSFLENGHYIPLIDKIIECIDPKENSLLLDAGCGEGYYGGQIADKIKSTTIIGFDISKEAIKKAAKKYKDQSFFIAGVNEIPLTDASIDTYLTIFAPLEAGEINRLLTADGQVIIVSAGPNHMREIAEEIYETFIPHDYNPIHKLKDDFKEISYHNLTFQIDLTTRDDMYALLMMTPYYWSVSKDNRDEILSTFSKTISCDFIIQVFQKLK